MTQSLSIGIASGDPGPCPGAPGNWPFMDERSELAWGCSAGGRLEQVSAAWLDYAGLAPGEGRLAGWETLIHSEDAALCAETWAAPMAAGQAPEIEVRLRRADGAYEWHLMRALMPGRARAASGRRWGTCVSIARLKEREEALLRANRMQEDFLGMVSHELRGPLFLVIASARLLLNPPVPLERGQELAALADIETEALRMLDRFDNLLALSRPDGPGSLETEPILVQHIVRRAVAQHLARFPLRPVAMTAEGRPGPATGVSTYVEEIVENLLSNAEKYTDSRSPIDIDLAETEGRLVVRVLDRGPGVNAGDLERIFEPFIRLHSPLDAPGAGLGLAVCRKLAEAQGGCIHAEQRPGGGSVFVLQLPLWHLVGVED